MIANTVFVAGGLVIRSAKLSRVLAYSRLGCVYGMTWYTYDSLREVIVERRWLYVPHHICSVAMFYKLFMDPPCAKTLTRYAALMALMEFSSVVVNARALLKERRALSWSTDACLFGGYTAVRMLVFPWCAHKYVKGRTLRGSSLAIFGMSALWTGKWARSLYRRSGKASPGNSPFVYPTSALWARLKAGRRSSS